MRRSEVGLFYGRITGDLRRSQRGKRTISKSLFIVDIIHELVRYTDRGPERPKTTDGTTLCLYVVRDTVTRRFIVVRVLRLSYLDERTVESPYPDR